jgi:hypothetical protein
MYTQEQVARIMKHLDEITITGIKSATSIAVIAQDLNNGIVEDIENTVDTEELEE